MSGAPLTFAVLRDANMRRLPTFRNAQGQLSHTLPNGADWSLNDWFTALVGGCGELEEELLDPTGEIDISDASDAIADVAIYLDLLALQVGAEFEAELTELFAAPFWASRGAKPLRLASFEDLSALISLIHYGRQAPTHPDRSFWSLADTLAAMFGQVGRLGNVLKKLRRGDVPARSLDKEIAGRLSGILINLGSLARRLGIDLGAAIVRKFNATSDKVGSPVRLGVVPATNDDEAPRKFPPFAVEMERILGTGDLAEPPDPIPLRPADKGDA